MAVSVLWLFLTVLWVGMQCVIMVLPDHTHYFFMENSFGQKRLSINVIALLKLETKKLNIIIPKTVIHHGRVHYPQN